MNAAFAHVLTPHDLSASGRRGRSQSRCRAWSSYCSHAGRESIAECVSGRPNWPSSWQMKPWAGLPPYQP